MQSADGETAHTVSFKPRHLRLPTIFRGTLKSWKCASWNLKDWADACEGCDFVFRSAPKEIDKQPRWENNADFSSTTIKQFVDRILESESNVFTDSNPLRTIDLNSYWLYTGYNYMRDVFRQKPDMFTILNWGMFGFEERDGRDSTLWIGTAGSHTPCHQDSYGENLVAQLYGRKLWILFPPEETSNLYPTRIPYEESSVFSSVNILNPDLVRFPTFSKAKMYAVILEPGEVLYVPPKWWHYVHCLDTSVSINTWIETRNDDLNRLEEAVVRLLMTAFIPAYRPLTEDWLNRNEDLMTPDETAKVVSVVLDRISSNSSEGNSVKEIDFTKATLSPESYFSVPEILRDQLEKMLDKFAISSYIKQSFAGSETCILTTPQYQPVEDLLNCIVDPNIIHNIVVKLQKSVTRQQ